MTKRELVVWIEHHGCEIEQLPEGRARCVKYYNPKTNGHAFLNTPIDDRPLNDYTIFRICVLLGIPSPDCAAHMKELHDDIEKETKD